LIGLEIIYDELRHIF